MAVVILKGQGPRSVPNNSFIIEPNFSPCLISLKYLVAMECKMIVTWFIAMHNSPKRCNLPFPPGSVPLVEIIWKDQSLGHAAIPKELFESWGCSDSFCVSLHSSALQVREIFLEKSSGACRSKTFENAHCFRVFGNKISFYFQRKVLGLHFQILNWRPIKQPSVLQGGKFRKCTGCFTEQSKAKLFFNQEIVVEDLVPLLFQIPRSPSKLVFSQGDPRVLTGNLDEDTMNKNGYCLANISNAQKKRSPVALITLMFPTGTPGIVGTQKYLIDKWLILSHFCNFSEKESENSTLFM